MRVVVLASTKGGTGKTTLSALLSARAARESKRVALIDSDAQKSLERWWELRGEPDNPRLLDISASREGIELLLAEGWDWVFIDTPPGHIEDIDVTVSCADFVLIPSRASGIDVEALGAVLDLSEDHKKPHGVLLNAVQGNWATLARSAEAMIADMSPGSHFKTAPVNASGDPIRIASRKAYVSAMHGGRTGAEIDKAAELEIEELWTWLKKTIAKQRKVRA
jgi:chromosome partitioning protein